MKKDYPQANARLAEVARSWAEGELSHDVWRKERRAIIKNIWLRKTDLDSTQFSTLPIKNRSRKNDTQTIPNITIPPIAAHTNIATTVLLTEDSEVLHEDVFLLAVLLFSMVLTTVFMVYMM